MEGRPWNAALLGLGLAIAVVAAAQVRGFAFLVAGLGLFLAAVVLQVRHAMASLRDYHRPWGAVGLVTLLYIAGASLVFAVVVPLADVDELSTVEIVFWWWPLAFSGLIVCAATDSARRRIRRWAASRQFRDAGGNGSA